MAKRKKRRVKKRKVRRVKKRKIRKVKKITKKSGPSNSESIFKVPTSWAQKAYVDKRAYEKKYKLSISENEKF